MNLPPFFARSHNQAIFALICANIIWGAASPIFKLSLQNIPLFTLAFLRFFGAMIILYPFTVSKISIKRKDWLNLFLLSVFGTTVNITFFFMGLQNAPSINAPIIASSGPVFIYLFSLLFLHEKNHPKILTGTIVSLIGVIIIISQPLLTNGLGGQFWGNIFFVLATLGTVIHAIILKKISNQYSASTLTFWSFLIGSLTFLPFFIFEMANISPLKSLDYRGILGIIFGIFLSSALAYSLFDWGIKRISAQEVGLFYYIDPIVATMIAIPLLGEVITSLFIMGSFLVFVGIVIAEGHLHYFHKKG